MISGSACNFMLAVHATFRWQCMQHFAGSACNISLAVHAAYVIVPLVILCIMIQGLCTWIAIATPLMCMTSALGDVSGAHLNPTAAAAELMMMMMMTVVTIWCGSWH